MSSPNSIIAWRSPLAGGAVVDVLQSSSNLLQYLTNEESSNDGRRPPSAHRKLFILFPGNPGIVQFYEIFCGEMESHKFDVLVMGFAGHSLTDLNNGRVFTLADQVDIADSFMATLVNKNTEQKYSQSVYVGGHSIGGFVALQMLARYPMLKKYFGLCPVISHIAASPNGRKVSLLMNPVAQWCLALLATLLEMLPYRLLLLLISWREPKLSTSFVETLAHHFHRTCFTNVVFMALTEFRMLLQPDAPLLRRVQERLVLYYVRKDDWAPPEYAEEIRKICPRLAGYVMEEDVTVPHCWCLAHNERVVQNAILDFC